MRRLWPYLLILFLSSCFPFARELREQIEPTINFQEIKKDPAIHQGKTVLLGGVIIETKNKPEESILLVRQTELDFEKRPKNLDQSSGRFMVKYKSFLDPHIYQEGREVTLIGDIEGKEVLPVGEIPYIYPVIRAKEIKLWPKRPAFIPVYPWYWERPYFWWPPYYRW